jgi:GNAT superfamily N-acetyltransferase
MSKRQNSVNSADISFARLNPSLDIVLLSSEELEQFQMLMPGFIYNQFAHNSTQVSRVIMGAVYFGKPVGIVIAIHNPVFNEALVVHLFVARQYRQRGIGSALLYNAEQTIFQFFVDSIYLRFIKSKHGKSCNIEEFLHKSGWGEPSLQYFLFKILPSPYIKEHFCHIQKTSTHFQLVKWAELGTTEIEQLRDSESDMSQDDSLYLSPFIDNFDPYTSVALISGGKILGWMITRETEDRSCVIESIYIAIELRGKADFLKQIITYFVRSWCERGYSSAVFYVSPTRPKALQLFRYLFKKLNPEIREVYLFKKDISVS